MMVKGTFTTFQPMVSLNNCSLLTEATESSSFDNSSSFLPEAVIT